MATAPDGKWIALVYGGTVHIWDVDRQVKRKVLSNRVTASVQGTVAIAPNGRWMATGHTNGTVTIWDVATWTKKATLTGYGGGPQGFAIAADGSWLATAGADRALRLRDARQLAERATFSCHPSQVLHMAIAPNADWLVTDGEDKTMRVWDSAASSGQNGSDERRRPVTTLAAMRGGGWVATASTRDPTIQIRDTRTGADLAKVVEVRPPNELSRADGSGLGPGRETESHRYTTGRSRT